MKDQNNFWYGKCVLVTGHTGFKGSWLCFWLHLLGARVVGFSLPPESKPNLFELLGLANLIQSKYGDVRDSVQLRELILETKPEIIFHLASVAIVKSAFLDPAKTFNTNVMGTVNLLEAVRASRSVKACQIVTSDKCYLNSDCGQVHIETDPLGGTDPYSASKAAVEITVASYRNSFFPGLHDCSIATVRAGNALGGGDWSEHRILPNCIRALKTGRPIILFDSEVIRPWQYVLEPISGYLALAQKQCDQPQAFAEAWNLGPELAAMIPLKDLVQGVINSWGCGSWLLSDTSQPLREASVLRISIAKAKARLDWSPTYDLQQTISETVTCYRNLYQAMAEAEPVVAARKVCMHALTTYVDRARHAGISWANDYRQMLKV